MAENEKQDPGKKPMDDWFVGNDDVVQKPDPKPTQKPAAPVPPPIPNGKPPGKGPLLAVLVALAVCVKLPTLGILAGAAPLVLLAVCLIPCLLPLAWLRNARRGKIEKTQAPENHLEG